MMQCKKGLKLNFWMTQEIERIKLEKNKRFKFKKSFLKTLSFFYTIKNLEKSRNFF
jgi:hypothetical protein